MECPLVEPGAELGFGLVASFLGLLTLPERSEALVNYACCTLCKSNSGSCSGCAGVPAPSRIPRDERLAAQYGQPGTLSWTW